MLIRSVHGDAWAPSHPHAMRQPLRFMWLVVIFVWFSEQARQLHAGTLRYGSKEGNPAGLAVRLSISPTSPPQMAQADAAKRPHLSPVLSAAAGQGLPGPYGDVPAILEPCHRPLHLAGACVQWAGPGHNNVSSLPTPYKEQPLKAACAFAI